MSKLLNTPPSIPDPRPAPLDEILPKVELLEDDGEPMESDWHVKNMVLLMSCIDVHFREREDYYVGGNMFIYFSEQQARNRDFRGPDFYFVWNTTRKPPRKYWVVWQEDGRTPDVVIELCSPSTIAEDLGRKKQIYQDILRVGDYFCYDPESQTLVGWRLNGKKYIALKPNPDGRLWSEELGLWVGTWKGVVGRYDDVWLRFFDPNAALVPNENEAALQRALAAEKEVDVIRREAKAAERRADEARAELERVRDQLAAMEKKAHAADNNGKRKKK